MSASRHFLIFLAFLAAFLTACGGGGGNTTTTKSVAVNPAIVSLSPSSTAIGSGAFTLSVTGANFISGSTVNWNGSARSTQLVDASHLTASIPAMDVNVASGSNVDVTVASPGGGSSAAMTFTLNNPLPALVSVSPTSELQGNSIVLTANGSGFVQSSVIRLDGNALSTTWVSSTQLTAAVALTTPGTHMITVMTAGPGGGTSGAIATTTIPVPTITSLAPASVVIGSGGFTLSVTGTQFATGATVKWNGIARTTSFVDSSHLTASILASDVNVAVGANISVMVSNPAPSAADSPLFSFALNNPVPAITSLSPGTQPQDPQHDFVLTINGGGFTPASVVSVDGVPATPLTFVNSGQVTTRVMLKTVGAHSVTVSNPMPGGGTSGSSTLTATAAGPANAYQMVSIDPGGNHIGADRGPLAGISATGRYVIFGSSATASDPNSDPVMVRDTCLGAIACTPLTSLIGEPQQFDDGKATVISADGRFAAFQRLVDGVGSVFADVNFADTCRGAGGGCAPSVQIIEPKPQASDFSLRSISSDGRYFSFALQTAPVSAPDNLYITDTCSSAPIGCVLTTYQQTIGIHASEHDAVTNSDDGRFLAYSATGSSVIHVRDTCFGAAPGCAPSDTGISDVTLNCSHARISANGRYVSYSCSQPATFSTDVFLTDTCNGAGACTPTTIAVTAGAGNPSFQPLSFNAGISGDGRYVIFYSTDNGLAPTKTTTTFDVFVYDSCIGAAPGCTARTGWVSLTNTGAQADSDVFAAAISADGRSILFSTTATNFSGPSPAGIFGSTLYVVPNPF